MQVSKYLRKSTQGYIFYCPGCKGAHHYYVGNATGPNWTFNGNVDCPTFNPSLRIFHPQHKDEDGVEHPEKTICHLFVTDGKINFCGDCQHELNGQQGVPLPELPYSMQDDRYGDGNP